MRYYMVRLDDEHGRFWMEADHMWSDSVLDGRRFAKRRDAASAAFQARATAIDVEDWFPKIKVISFKAEK